MYWDELCRMHERFLEGLGERLAVEFEKEYGDENVLRRAYEAVEEGRKAQRTIKRLERKLKIDVGV